MKPKIIYVYDALCGWCFGFSPVIMAVHDAYHHEFDFEIISGGMMIGNRAGRVSDVAPSIRNTYKTVEETTGVVFGMAFIRNLEEGYMVFNSERTAIGLSVCKSLLPEKAFEFATHLQNSIFFDGKEPDHTDLYRYLAANFGIDPDDFANKMDDQVFKEAARYDFALAKQLQVGSYPAVLIQYTESKFYLVARGYANYETMELRISNVRKEIGL